MDRMNFEFKIKPSISNVFGLSIIEGIKHKFSRVQVCGLYKPYYKKAEVYLYSHANTQELVDTIVHESLHHCLNEIDEKYNTEENVDFILTELYNEDLL